MAEKAVPWWRKALNFALGGIRTGFGLLARLAKADPALEPEITESSAKSLEEDTILIEDFPKLQAVETETTALPEAAAEAESALATKDALAIEPALELPEPKTTAPGSATVFAPEAPIQEESNGGSDALPVLDAALLQTAEEPEPLRVPDPGPGIELKEAAGIPPTMEEGQDSGQGAGGNPPTVQAVLDSEELSQEPNPGDSEPSASEGLLPAAGLVDEADPSEDTVPANPAPPVIMVETEALGVEEQPEASVSPANESDEAAEAEAPARSAGEPAMEAHPEAAPIGLLAVADKDPTLPPAFDVESTFATPSEPLGAHEPVPEQALETEETSPETALAASADESDVEEQPVVTLAEEPEEVTDEPALAPKSEPVLGAECSPLAQPEPTLETAPEIVEASAETVVPEPDAEAGPVALPQEEPTPDFCRETQACADEGSVAPAVEAEQGISVSSEAPEEQISAVKAVGDSAAFAYGFRTAAFTPASLAGSSAAGSAAEQSMAQGVEAEVAPEAPVLTEEPPKEPPAGVDAKSEPAADADESTAHAELAGEMMDEDPSLPQTGVATESVLFEDLSRVEAGVDLESTAETITEPLGAAEQHWIEDLPPETASEGVPLVNSVVEALPGPDAGATVQTMEENESAAEPESAPIREDGQNAEAEGVGLADDNPAAESELVPGGEPAPATPPAAGSDAAQVSEPAPGESAVPESVGPAGVEPPAAVHSKPQITIKSRDNEADLSPFSVIVDQVYDGPLDLLLDLIRKQDIDIYDIPIAKITAQFLAYVNQLKAGDMDVAGEFIYTASLLIHIKSKMLLPRTPTGPDDAVEDPRRELVERLLEHERFKNAAQMLQQKQMLEAATWTNPGMREFKGDAGTEPEIAADTVDLVRIFRDILERARKRPVFNVDEDQVTVGQMIQYLSRRLNMEDKPVALRRLLSHTRSERSLIAMFLALLELVRLQAILLRQDAAFSEIFIKKHSGFDAVMNQGLANPQDDWR
jgi:segregation and condensation protein A